MLDPRFDALAEVLIGFSTNLKKGERFLIDAYDVPPEIVIALIRSGRSKGAFPFVNLQSNTIVRELLRGAEEDQYRTLCEFELARMTAMDAYVALRGSHNATEFSDVDPDRMQVAMKLLQPLLERRVNKTKWVVLRWPTPAMAQMAGMSTEAFEDYYFKVCTLDYSRMKSGMKALKAMMESTDQVRDQRTGHRPDVQHQRHSLPLRAAASTTFRTARYFLVLFEILSRVTFNSMPRPIYQGTAFDSVRLAFKKGKVVEASANNTGRLNAILNSDEGARYIGEFALGFNPHIQEPMRDILFDEKIAGSFHFTPGQAYERADNGNRSQVHWDLVCIQRPEYGGGEIYFDRKLLRKDGLFVPKDIQALNPEHLAGANAELVR